MISPNPHPPPRIEVETETLALARRILRLSMNENDMAKGLKACTYAAVLLNRLIAYYEKQSEPLPDHITEMEEELQTRILDNISPLVARKTGGVPLNTVVRQLVSEVQQSRRERRANRNQPRRDPHGDGHKKKRAPKRGARKNDFNRKRS